MDIMTLSDRNDYDDGFEEGFVREQLTGSNDPEWFLKRLIHQNRLANLEDGDTVIVELITRDSVINPLIQKTCSGFVYRDDRNIVTVFSKSDKVNFDPKGWPEAKCYMKRIVLVEKINKLFLRQ